MTTKHRSFSWLALVTLCASSGCVQNRAARNGVFNENQYVRKDFLVRAADSNSQDPGWFMGVTINQTSTPNVLGDARVGGSLFAGAASGTPNRVRFSITQDKLQLLDMRELSNDQVTVDQNLRTPSIINAWPATNVDLKYRINLDGETTNFFEENQEQDWQQRQWMKLNFGKNDLSDLAPLYGDLNPVIIKCTNTVDASASLVPGSFKVDTDNGYMEFGVSVTLPIYYLPADAATCVAAFGSAANMFYKLGRSAVTLNLLYSFVRPDKLPNQLLDGTYVPFTIDEKDPIRHKYGAFESIFYGDGFYRDQNSGLLGAKQFVMRFDPNKDIVWYFSPGMPKKYTDYFAAPGGVVDQTNNTILSKTGGKGRLKMLNADDDKVYGDHGLASSPKHIGDVRYSFVIWHSDFDNSSNLGGIAQFNIDPATGQILSATTNVFEGQIKDVVQQRLDFFLQTAGAEYLDANGEFDNNKYPATCTTGQTTPLVGKNVADQINAGSTVYGKMQAYLQKPVSQFGNLGPANFLPTHDTDFFNAFFAVIPYQVYADPEANFFVTPEGSVFGASAQQNWEGLQKLVEFNELAAKIDHGEEPWDVNASDGLQQAVAFNHRFNQLTDALVNYEHVKARRPLASHSDDISLFSYLDIYQKNGRHCVNNAWESRAEYTDRLVTSLNNATALHELGHTLGLRHNFMGSIDQRNFPVDSVGNPTMYSSSIMDYNTALSDAFFAGNGTGWPPYDAAALAFIYANNLTTATAGPKPTGGMNPPGISGQVSATAPWNDPLGFNATTERPFLYCSDEHIAYSPLCHQGDMGVTPSEIVANAIQQREWNYLWTNFRLYHKIFDVSAYGANTVTTFTDFRRFISLGVFDWNPGELTNTLRLIGTPIPPGSNAGDYYTALTNKFDKDLSVASQLAATYHRAIIDQSSGERPFITVFDPFFGDTTQQGIQIDKLVTVSSFSSLWPAISNFDPSQSGSFMLSSTFADDSAYASIANGVVLDFLGAAFATYTYAQIGPIAAWAETTHSSFWPATSPAASWIGGLTFYRERDFLDFLHSAAVRYQFPNCDENGLNCDPCTSLDHCTWDPRIARIKASQSSQSDRTNSFVAPDGRTYIWMYLQSRNQWVLADKDRNVALYTLILNWTNVVINGEDDGFGGALALELKVKYAIDAFQYYNNFQPNTP